MAPKSFTFNHPQFTDHEDGLGFYRAERATVLVGSVQPGPVHQICQITFHRRLGSVFAQFGYFGTSSGVAGEYHTRPGAKDQVVHLGAVGLVASTPIKYSHPPDGRSHFSQDGKVVSAVRRQSFRLDGPEGHLFELHAYGVNSFKELQPGQERSKRLYLPWVFADSMPPGVTLGVEWRRKSAIRSEVTVENQGPLLMLRRRVDGMPFKAMLLGQPRGFPLQDHLLVVNVGAAKPASGVDRPTMIFFGGWDEHERSRSPVEGGGYLTFVYPAGNVDDLLAAGRTIDWQP
jgi:hypothetical protein